jgi:site-specific DNA-methyltransferase (adenine-specific)
MPRGAAGAVAKPPEKPKKENKGERMKPYYEEVGIAIFLGDCREVLPSLPDTDLGLTDPPYNSGKKYGQHNDSMDPDAYAAWCAQWFPLLRARTRRVILFCGHGNLGVWYALNRPSAVGCWFKPGNGASSIIGYEEWEPWLYWHGGHKGLLGGSSVIRQPLDTSGNEMAARAGHPCPKPVALMTKLLIKSRTDGIIDPFLGAGSTLIAAKELGIPAIGIELEERFCELSARRLSQGVFDFSQRSAK